MLHLRLKFASYQVKKSMMNPNPRGLLLILNQSVNFHLLAHMLLADADLNIRLYGPLQSGIGFITIQKYILEKSSQYRNKKQIYVSFTSSQ